MYGIPRSKVTERFHFNKILFRIYLCTCILIILLNNIYKVQVEVSVNNNECGTKPYKILCTLLDKLKLKKIYKTFYIQCQQQLPNRRFLFNGLSITPLFV